jgi:GNAT superfamily N-acetyltransferase
MKENGHLSVEVRSAIARGEVALRTATPADIPNVIALLEAAYGRKPTFGERFTAYLSLEPGGWVVVESASALVGVGGFVSYGRCAYLGLIGVSPQAQRRGIGIAIVEDLLRRCDALGHRLLLLDASDPGAPLYERYSFRDQGTSFVYTIDPHAAGRALDDSPVVAIDPIDAGDERTATEVAAFDARVFGADRSPLVHYYLRAFRGRAFAARDPSGELVGYSVGQSLSFGPCMARSTDVARALARRTLALPYEGAVTWLVAGQNRDAAALALAMGGVPVGTRRHMRRGDAAQLASEWSSLFAKASHAVG